MDGRYLKPTSLGKGKWVSSISLGCHICGKKLRRFKGLGKLCPNWKKHAADMGLVESEGEV